ncbi:hypothetical protein BBK82_16245 [Lentzea guizhouensis]|uniref:Uncharacterized protein n=1 Tax=Lentzea guizhouensis TaxID=1586287 RepID=A0A1B2HI20_9PSEU|nr:hypothetical protein BBK82_16245 [Lentzea guizhouensis]
MLESAAAVRSESWLLADAWASEVVASLWLGSWRFPEPSQAFESEHEKLVAGVSGAGDEAALTALRALSGVASGDLAAEAAESLAAQGVADPAWFVPGAALEFREAFLVTNLLGDVEVVAITQERAGAVETVLFMRQPVLGATAIELFATPAEGTTALLQDMIASAPGAFRDLIMPMSASEAFDRVWPDIELFWNEEPDEEAEAGLLDDDEEARHPIQLMALADARVRALVPDDYTIPERPDRTDEVVAAFLASEHGAALPDAELAGALARVLAGEAAAQDRDPVAYGPASLTGVLILAVAARLHVSDEDLALLPEVMRAWAYFTADARDLPREEAREAWDAELPTVLAEFSEAYADPELEAERDGQLRG